MAETVIAILGGVLAAIAALVVILAGLGMAPFIIILFAIGLALNNPPRGPGSCPE